MSQFSSRGVLYPGNGRALDMAEQKIAPPGSPDGRIRLDKHVPLQEHRSGWSFCIDALKRLHNDNGVFFDDFVEQRFSWDFRSAVERGLVPYSEPWIGCMHNPPDMPAWFEYCSSPQVILGRPLMQESLKNCKGLYVFSDNHRRWLQQHVSVPVEALVHPTDCRVPSFSPDMYLRNPRRKIIQVGCWLRRIHSIRHLDVDGFVKVWIAPNAFALECRHREARTMDVFTANGDEYVGRYEEWMWVPHDVYDALLQRNVVFLHLYDASAVNALLECIARNTPVLVNPLPAVVEYLGEDYPLYFEELAEAAAKVRNWKLVAQAHEYLLAMDKHRFTAEHFVQSIVSSKIYQGLDQTGSSRAGQARESVVKLPRSSNTAARS